MHHRGGCALFSEKAPPPCALCPPCLRKKAGPAATTALFPLSAPIRRLKAQKWNPCAEHAGPLRRDRPRRESPVRGKLESGRGRRTAKPPAHGRKTRGRFPSLDAGGGVTGEGLLPALAPVVVQKAPGRRKRRTPHSLPLSRRNAPGGTT